jgi:tetratricopeptide (TPR) repeat protein
MASFGLRGEPYAVLGVFAVAFSLRSSPVKDFFHAKTAGTSATKYEHYHNAQNLLMKSYQHSNRIEAIGQFQALLAQDPNFTLAHAGLGSAYLIQMRSLHDAKLLDQVKAETNRAIELNTDLAAPFDTLARIAAIDEQTSLAMQQAQKALELDPSSADAHPLAEVYKAERRKPEAIDEYRRCRIWRRKTGNGCGHWGFCMFPPERSMRHRNNFKGVRTWLRIVSLLFIISLCLQLLGNCTLGPYSC